MGSSTSPGSLASIARVIIGSTTIADSSRSIASSIAEANGLSTPGMSITSPAGASGSSQSGGGPPSNAAPSGGASSPCHGLSPVRSTGGMAIGSVGGGANAAPAAAKAPAACGGASGGAIPAPAAGMCRSMLRNLATSGSTGVGAAASSACGPVGATSSGRACTRATTNPISGGNSSGRRDRLIARSTSPCSSNVNCPFVAVSIFVTSGTSRFAANSGEAVHRAYTLSKARLPERIGSDPPSSKRPLRPARIR